MKWATFGTRMFGVSIDTHKARQRLKQAQRFAVDLRFVKTFSEFEDAWLNFLLHAKGVYTHLEIGCKRHPTARQWFGAKKKERREDELLQYVFQSRDFAEHEPGQGAKLSPGFTAIGVTAPGMSNAICLDGSFESGLRVTALDGKPVKVVQRPSTIALLPVTGRGGITYPPPKTHLGSALADRTPEVVVDRCNAYLSALLDEADKLTR